jgi:rod shape-determining protein MreC
MAMESMFFRYRNLLMLLAILAAQIVGLAMQVRRTGDGRNTLDPQDGPGVRLIRLWAVAMIAPPEQLIHSSKMGLAGLWQNYLILHNVREQNQELQRTIERLRLEQAALLEDARQGQRLQGIVNFQQKYIYKTLAAQAFGSSGSDQSRIFYLDKGSADGLERDMAVITADGIVGKVREVFPHTAQVLAINDQSSGAGVILETTRIRGILRGNAAGQLQIVGILADQRIQPGEKVITAGGDQIFPRGMPVGVVEKVLRDPERDSFIDVIVKPAARLDRLDEVLVITSTQPRFSPEEQQDLATSETLKGPEAAAIKEQQKASQIMAERLPGLNDPNAPAPGQAAIQAPGASAAQPAQGQGKTIPSAPGVPPAPKLLHAQHPDRFSPAGAAQAASESGTDAKPKPGSNTKPTAPTGAGNRPAPKAGMKSRQGPKPQQHKPQETEPRRKP